MGMEDLISKQKQLMDMVPHGVSELTARRMVAGLDVTEETLEYLNSTGYKPWRPIPLEEVDFFESPLADELRSSTKGITIGECRW